MLLLFCIIINDLYCRLFLYYVDDDDYNGDNEYEFIVLDPEINGEREEKRSLLKWLTSITV